MNLIFKIEEVKDNRINASPSADERLEIKPVWMTMGKFKKTKFEQRDERRYSVMKMLSIEELKNNSYPGEKVVIRKTQDGTKLLTAYFIMKK